MSEGKTVLVRAFGGEPLVRKVVRTHPLAVVVCNPQTDDGSSIGFPLRDVFEMDAALSRRLRTAYLSEDKALASIWQEAIPLRVVAYEAKEVSNVTRPKS